MKTKKDSKFKYNIQDRAKKSRQSMTNEQQAAEKARIAKTPLKPNREPFDQGTSI